MRVGRLSLPKPNVRGLPVDHEAFTVSGLIDLSTEAAARDLRHSLLGMRDRLEPVSWLKDPGLDGWYHIDEVHTESVFADAGRFYVPWSMEFSLVNRSLRIAETLSPVTRSNAHAVTAQRWHAPPRGMAGYHAGTFTGGTVDRGSSEGNLAVHIGVPTDIDAEWLQGSPEELYEGAPRIETANGQVVTGLGQIDPVGWTLTNDILRVQDNTAVTTLRFLVDHWNGTAFSGGYHVVPREAGGDAAKQHELIVLKNDASRVSLMLVSPATSAGGRFSVVLTLMRGARHAVVSYHRHSSATIRLYQYNAAVAHVGFTGGQREDKVGGPRLFFATPFAFTSSLATPSPHISSSVTVTSWTAIFGIEPDAAVVNDQAAELFRQFLGTPAPRLRVVR